MKPKLAASDFALWAALPMAHTSKIEGRIGMILDRTRPRTLPRRAFIFGVAVGAAVLAPLAVLKPIAKAQAASHQTAIFAESQEMQRERQYALENGRFMGGQHSSPQEAAVQEKQIAVNPNNYAAHLRLLGYYFNGWFQSKPATSVPVLTAYRQQLFWLIQNHPESLLFSSEDLWLPKFKVQAVFRGDTALWQEQIARHPGSTVVLGNAAGYNLLPDRALAEQYLLRAQALEPTNPEWPDRLGELYLLRGPHPSAAADDQALRKAFAEYETAANLEKGTLQADKLAELASLAFAVFEYDKARQYANALLKQGEQVAAAGKADPRILAFTFPQSDYDIHEANSVLGRLALHDGNIAEAEAHLLAMGHVSNSRVLSTVGPSMELAHDLLERGDRRPVLTYFDECAKFWHDNQLGVWRSQVEQGKMPNFGGNLYH